VPIDDDVSPQAGHSSSKSVPWWVPTCDGQGPTGSYEHRGQHDKASQHHRSWQQMRHRQQLPKSAATRMRPDSHTDSLPPRLQSVPGCRSAGERKQEQKLGGKEGILTEQTCLRAQSVL